MICAIDAEVLVSPKGGASRELRVQKNKRVNFNSKTGLILSLEKAPARSSRRVRLLAPGFVDPHTHLIFAGQRASEWNRRLKGESYASIAKKGGGIQTTVRATRGATEAELLKEAKKRARKFLEFGVTTLEVKSGYGLSFQDEFKILKVATQLRQQIPQQILITYMGAHALSPEFKTTREYIEHMIESDLARVAELADFQDIFVEKGYFSESEAIKILNAGKKLGLKPKVHAHEFGRTGGVSAAIKTKSVSADHLQYTNALDLKRLKQAKTVPVILPGTSQFLGGKKFADAKAMWKAGLPVAIASDFNPGTNPSMNFPMVGSLAAIYQGLSLDQVFVAQTKHAALALDLNDRGVVAPGYRADFVTYDIQSFEEIYYHVGTPLVESVYVGGKKIL